MKLNYIKTLFVAILVIFTTTAYGETYSGTCGTNVNWSLNTSTGLLKITGTGEMNNSRPWKSYNSSIKSVEIAEGEYFHEQEEASAPSWCYIVEGCNVSE